MKITNTEIISPLQYTHHTGYLPTTKKSDKSLRSEYITKGNGKLNITSFISNQEYTTAQHIKNFSSNSELYYLENPLQTASTLKTNNLVYKKSHKI